MSNKTTISIMAVTIIVIAVIVGVLYDNQTNDIQSNSKTQEPIKIGFSTPLTGSAASWGEKIKNGAKIAIDEINMSGGINGRALEVIFEDDMCDPKKGVSIVNKFINIDKVSAITGMPCSSVALSMSPIINDNKTILLTSGASSPAMKDAGDYVFNLYPLDDAEFGYLSEYIYNSGVRTIALLWLNNDYGTGAVEIFNREYKGEVLESEKFSLGDIDFRLQLTKIKNSNPNGLVIISNPGEIPMIIRQLHEIGIVAKLFANSPVVESDEFDSEIRALADGLVYAMPSNSENEVAQIFARKYTDTYGDDPSITAPLGYDSINLLARAFEFAGTEGNDVRRYLIGVENYDGASGILSFDEKGNVQKPFTFKQIKNGELVPIY